MSPPTNEYKQPVGEVVSGWIGVDLPSQETMVGRYCQLEALSIDVHGQDLFTAYSTDEHGTLWTYMPVGPFGSMDQFESWMKFACASTDPMFFAVVDKATQAAVGVASYLRMDPASGVIEVGYLAFSPLLQRTTAATEAMYLMMNRAFSELGYRRYEWKCNALNLASQRAADRLGFHYEGTFRQAAVVKGRNRDTAWYSILDTEWPRIQKAFTNWLKPENFDANGNQRQALGARKLRS